MVSVEALVLSPLTILREYARAHTRPALSQRFSTFSGQTETVIDPMRRSRLLNRSFLFELEGELVDGHCKDLVSGKLASFRP
jgi:hypothetical protein